MFEDVGMMWLVLAGKEKSAGVPLVFEPRAAKGTIESNHRSRRRKRNAFFFFSKKKKKKELKNVQIWTMRFHSKRSAASNNNNKSPNDAAIGLVRSRRFV